MHAGKHDTEAREREVEEAYCLFTNGTEGPITVRDLKRVAKALGEEVGEEALKDMILEANGGAGVSRGVGREEFEEVMRRAGVWH
jgi:hydroxyacylglutathione hydrolase